MRYSHEKLLFITIAAENNSHDDYIALPVRYDPLARFIRYMHSTDDRLQGQYSTKDDLFEGHE